MKSRNFGKKMNLIIFLGTALILNSCAGMNKYRPYARNVKKKPGRSGVVALKLEHRKEDRDLAKSFMKDNCGTKKSKILDEGEVVIGTTTNSNSKSREGGTSNFGSLFGIPLKTQTADSTSKTSTTTQEKEWQITYKCS
jgi:hypothetical protein